MSFQFKRRGRGRTTRRIPGTMNRTEQRYADLLQVRLLAGEILWWAYEPWKFKLASLCFLTPDFGVMRPDGTLECHEVKGGWIEEDAMIKLKTLGELHPFVVILAQQKKVSEPFVLKELT